jgi:hypothetical protein
MYVECRQTSLKNWLLHLPTAALQAMHYKEWNLIWRNLLPSHPKCDMNL